LKGRSTSNERRCFHRPIGNKIYTLATAELEKRDTNREQKKSAKTSGKGRTRKNEFQEIAVHRPAVKNQSPRIEGGEVIRAGYSKMVSIRTGGIRGRHLHSRINEASEARSLDTMRSERRNSCPRAYPIAKIKKKNRDCWGKKRRLGGTLHHQTLSREERYIAKGEGGVLGAQTSQE